MTGNFWKIQIFENQWKISLGSRKQSISLGIFSKNTKKRSKTANFWRSIICFDLFTFVLISSKFQFRAFFALFSKFLDYAKHHVAHRWKDELINFPTVCGTFFYIEWFLRNWGIQFPVKFSKNQLKTQILPHLRLNSRQSGKKWQKNSCFL